MTHDDDSGSRSFFDRIVHAFGGDPRDLNDLLDVMRAAHQRDIIDADMLRMTEGVFKVNDVRVRDIMVPRTQMVIVEKDMQFGEIIETIVGSGHSRFPVIGEDKDDVIGVLLAKDLLKYNQHAVDSFDIQRVTRPALLTPESKRVNVLLKEFRSNRNHLAIVLDEYGGVAGLVTIEDVLEEIVGEIDDEFDMDEDVSIRRHGDGRYSVKALTPIDEFNETLQATLDEQEFDTIGGLVMSQIGHMPKPGESARIGEFHFKVLAADSRRLHLLQVTCDPGDA